MTTGAEKLPIFRCFLAVVTWFLNFSKIALVCFNRMQEDTFVPNLVQIGRQTAGEKKRKGKKQIDRKNIIFPKFSKIEFWQKRPLCRHLKTRYNLNKA